MPNVESPVTLLDIIRLAYTGSFRNRFENAERTVKRRVYIESVTVWAVNYKEGTPKRDKTHTYRVRVQSVREDGSVSKYPVTLLLDKLSLSSPVKLRCGGLSKFSNKRTMEERDICPDFYFRGMNTAKRRGYLFERDSTNRQAPEKTNPDDEVMICKHIWGAIIDLVESKFLGDTPDNLNLSILERVLGYRE
jgi:hypothetical protein